MREIGKDLSETKKRVELLKGINVIIKVNEGRNKITNYSGKVENLYPSVFTFKTSDENVKTFPYADVLTKAVRFYKNWNNIKSELLIYRSAIRFSTKNSR